MRNTNQVVSDSWYVWAGWIVGTLTCIGVWIYSLSLVGILGGIVIGWLPGLIAGFIAGVAWPLTVIFFIVGVISQIF